MDGRKVNFMMYQPQSNQWVEEQTNGNTKTTITRHFEQNIMKVCLEVNGVSAESIFRRR